MRSDPGHGRKIALYLLHEESVADEVLRPVGRHKSVIIPTHGEDYAVCGAPVTVKVAAGISKQTLINHLEDFIECLRDPKSDLFLDMPAEPTAPELDKPPMDETF